MTDRYSLTRRPPFVGNSDRPVYWYDYQTGDVFLAGGKSGKIDCYVPIGELLDKIMVHAKSRGMSNDAVYIRSGQLEANRPNESYIHSSLKDWSTVARFSWKTSHSRYIKGGFTIDLYCTGKFFGEYKNLANIRNAYFELEEILQHKFKLKTFKFYSTPANAGRELLCASLPFDHEYKRLPDDLLELVQTNFGQGRIQVMSPKHDTLPDGLYLNDGIWMYAACLNNLPTGEPVHDNVNEFAHVIIRSGPRAGQVYPHVPGFYRVQATVPTEWNHIGLLKAAMRSKDYNWQYPNEPGQTFESWATALEIATAINHNWEVEILERIIFPNKQTNPLEVWGRKLVELRESLGGDSEIIELMRYAIRSIMLQAIGSLHRLRNFEDRVIYDHEPPPTNPRQWTTIAQDDSVGSRTIRRRYEPSDYDKAFNHPEWTGAIWGNARARLANFILDFNIPYDDIVALSTDCVWTRSYHESVDAECDGKRGSFRMKEHITVKQYHKIMKTSGDWHWPKTGGEMRDFVEKYN